MTILISQKVELLNISHTDPIRFLEKVARTCYKSENLIQHGSAERLIRNLIEKGHEAMLEHVTITVKFTTNRAIANEIVRHRMASYAQESTRYCNYSKDTFGKNLKFVLPMDIDMESYTKIFDLYLKIEELYLTLIKSGITPEMARGILPLDLATELIMTANLREWRHFIKLRGSKEAHPQIRSLTEDLVEQFQDRIPIIFNGLL